MCRVNVVACVVAGFFVGANAAAAAESAREPVPLKDRVFFERGDWAQELAAVATTPPQTPAREEVKLLPVADNAPQARLRRADSRTAASRIVLAWAPTPAVPQLLSKPVEQPKPAAGRSGLPVLEDREQLAFEGAIARRAANLPVHTAMLERRKALTERGRLPITKLSRERMSTRWSDPLAILEIEEDAVRPAAAEFIMPFANGRVTSLFNQGRRHPAIDLAGKLGSPVLSTTNGQTVVFASWRGGYGNAVITRDGIGRLHLYGHLKSITARVGRALDQGDLLGHLGSTGRSTGPHVHYEVRNAKGGHINPVTLLFPGRTASKGLAWADVGQFGGSTQVAARPVASERLAVAKPVEAEPRRARAKRKYRAKQYVTAGYTHRSRRAWSDDDE